MTNGTSTILTLNLEIRISHQPKSEKFGMVSWSCERTAAGRAASPSSSAVSAWSPGGSCENAPAPGRVGRKVGKSPETMEKNDVEKNEKKLL